MTSFNPFAAAVRPLRQSAVLFLSLLLLSACGGGSGGGGSSASLQLLADGTGSPSGVVGQPLAQVPGVRVLDGAGAPVSGAAVTFRALEPGASVTPGTVNTGVDGRARPSSWILGTRAGVNTLVATVSGATGEVRVTANALPGPAAAIFPASIQQQTGDTSQPVANPPAVRVNDSFGNGVPGVTVEFAVEQGGGAISGTSATSDANGIARLLSWTLGSDEGLNEVSASVAGVGSIGFVAEALPPLALSIDSVQLNQATQSAAADIAAVAGREALLRVVISASRSNTETPDVLVRLFRDGVQLWERRLPATTSGVPVNPVLGALTQTRNIVLTPGEVQPGLAVEAILDPNEQIALASRESTRFPRAAGQAPILVRELPPLRVLFIPVRATQNNATGEIFPATVDQFLAATRLWLPVGELESELRSVFVTDRDLTDIDEVSGLLNDLQALRTAESAGDRYYHGIIPDLRDLPVAGIAFRPFSPSSSFRTALSFDRLPVAAETVAHELAHNLGREHSPCGDPDNVDPDYPYDGARIGATGYNTGTDALVDATTHFDYMAYCRPRWTSDYTYGGIIDWRLQDGLASAGAAPAADALPELAAAQPGVLLWGRVHSDGVELNPGFALEAQAVLPDRGGPHRLLGLAQDGSVLFDLSFAGAVVPHARDPAERQFAWFVPLSPEQLANLGRVELSSPYGSAQQSAQEQLPAADVEQLADSGGSPAVQQRLPGGGLRISWDAQRSPVALVRDRRSGGILGIGRSGELSFDAVAAAGVEPELVLSDGLRTRREIPLEVQ